MHQTVRRIVLTSIGVFSSLLVTTGALGQNGGPNPEPDSLSTKHNPGHSSATPFLTAIPRSGPIRLDGRLDDGAWNRAPMGSDFRQQQPDDGNPATQRTEIRFLYDDEALYVGARMYDDLGGVGVRSQLVRRDQQFASSDFLNLVFDTYHDHIGRTTFTVNPSGVKQDAGQASAMADPSWDPVWEVATAIDSLGWTAELRIPFSQLRFNRDAEQTWGLQVWRNVSRLNELSMWSYWSREEAGGASQYGHLQGIKISGTPSRGEMLPYGVAQYEALKPGPAGDPFYDPHNSAFRAGADIKYRLSSSLTLDATVYPDFGQVEVDPAVVNLSAFETFFPERRPFFIEGNGIFQFGGMNCFFCSNASGLSMFYSRRIGRQPQGSLPPGAEYSDRPDATSILAAGKMTGRTKSGWSVGVLNAVTASETARILTDGVTGHQQVEPLTNYFVGRTQKNLNNGNLTIGAIATSVIRQLDAPLLRSRIPSHAEGLGVDWNWFWGNRSYRVMGSLAGSNVSGDPGAIDRLQRSSARYFQRSDRGNGSNGLFSDAYDPTATNLRGYAGYARVAKESGAWLWEAAVNLRSPGFEMNDIAFLTQADYVYLNANLVRNLTTPTHWYRSALLILGGHRQYNFDGDLTDEQYQVFGQFQFLNYWSVGGFYLRRPGTLDDRALRGGPAVQRPSMDYWSLRMNTDTRKAMSFNADGSLGVRTDGTRTYRFSSGANVRPASNIQINIAPSFSHSESGYQYLTTIADPTATQFDGYRYVVADLTQENLSIDTRVNVTFSPTLTLELFMQPFVSSVDYDRFKEFDAPRSSSRSVYGEDVGRVTPVIDELGRTTAFEIDPDGSGDANAFTIGNPDFNFRSLRGNLVLRWEYRPGSTIFLVWTQDRFSHEPFAGNLSVSDDISGLRGAKPDNIFLIKFNYWLSF